MSSACSHKYSTDYKQAFAFSPLFSASCVSLQDKRMIVVKACLCVAVPDQKPHRLTNGEIHKTVMNYGAFLHRQNTDKVSRTLWGLPLTGYYKNLPKNTIYWYKVLHRALTAQGLQHTCPMINMLYEQIIAYKCFSLASRYNIDLDALIKITMCVLTEQLHHLQINSFKITANKCVQNISVAEQCGMTHPTLTVWSINQSGRVCVCAASKETDS